MKSLTKNHQTENTIFHMVEHCFPTCGLAGYQELTEGYFNVAYEVVLCDGRHLVLKVAPAPGTRIMTYEINIMHTEVQAMEMARLAGLPVPKVLGFDESLHLCPSPYFFMEKLKGESLNQVKSRLYSTQIASIHQEVGNLCRQINKIVCPCFGYPGQSEFQGKEWYPVFRKMLCAGINDADRGGVDLKINTDLLLRALERDRSLFEEVTTPALVHWDCWDGNIFVKDGKVTGIIDWERALWADPLMEVGFRSYAPDSDFIRGYGAVLTNSQKRRALWYDIYLTVLVSLECVYRQYETMEVYHRSIERLLRQVEQLETER